MIAHYRKSRDKSYGIVAGEATGLLRGRFWSFSCGEGYGTVAERSGRSGRYFWFVMYFNMAEILCRDYFPMEESSLGGRNSLQGCFSSDGIIPGRKKFFAEIIFQWRNHPKSGKILCRDAFSPETSSLNGRNALLGLFSSGEIISGRQKFFAGMLFQWWNHPWAAKILSKDAFVTGNSLPQAQKSN